MASMILTATVGTALTASIGKSADPIAPTVAIDYTNVAADIATLVADGASPTQAHVTALNGHWTTLKALIDAATAAATTANTDLLLSVNGTNVITKNKLDEILRAMRRLIEGSNLLT